MCFLRSNMLDIQRNKEINYTLNLMEQCLCLQPITATQCVQHIKQLL